MNKFRVLLVYPNLQMVMLLPNSIAILTAYLKNNGIEVRLFDTTLYRTAEKSVDDIRVEHMQLRPFNLRDKGVEYKETDVFDDFKKTVSEYKPDLIAVSTTDDTFDLGMKLASKIRDAGIHVVAGGIYPTFSPEEALSNPNVDSICMGEGEEALLELCKNLQDRKDITSIKNIWVKKEGKIYKNGLRRPIDINALPYEDFDIFEDKRIYRPMQGKIFKMIPVSMDRGCPYSCTFCAAPVQRKLYLDMNKTKYFRIKSISRVIDELVYDVAKYGANYIYFNSETFFAGKEAEIESFSKEYAAQIGLPFWCQTRIETITKKKIEMLESMNCDRISVGIEHGNEAFRKRILQKNFTNKQAVDVFKLLEKSKIAVTVNNIIGFPDETRELAFDTIRLNRSIKADSINAYFFTPYTGTPLRQYCIEKKYFDIKSDIVNPMRGTMLNMPQFSSEAIAGLVRTFPLYVKMPESYFEKIKIAEQLNEEGDKALSDLREIYYKEYFS